MRERTLVNIGYSAIERGIVGGIVKILSLSGARIIGADTYRQDPKIAAFCQDPPFLSLVLEGDGIFEKIKKRIGDEAVRDRSTILGRYGGIVSLHTPEKREEAEEEIRLLWKEYKHLGGPITEQKEQTLVIIKPNAFKPFDPRTGDVMEIVESTGARLSCAKVIIPKREEMERFYIIHREKHFFSELCEFMSEKPSLALLYEGENIRSAIREVALSVIREAYSESILENTLHTSETEDDFIREMDVVNFLHNMLPEDV
jgi:nucleoside-diphosphate kinase